MSSRSALGLRSASRYRASSSPAVGNLFTASWANVDISGAATAPGSDDVVTALAASYNSASANYIGDAAATDYDTYSFGASGFPYFSVPANQPMVAISGNIKNTGGQAPIPPSAQALFPTSFTNDNPMVIVKPSTGEVWELYGCAFSGGAWSVQNAGYIANAAVSDGTFGEVSPAGAGISASQICYAGLMITQDDIAGVLAGGSINHPIPIQLAGERTQYYPPATQYDSGATNITGPTPCEGMWFKLDSGAVYSGYETVLASAVMQAMKTYGYVITDRGVVQVQMESWGTSDATNTNYWVAGKGQTTPFSPIELAICNDGGSNNFSAKGGFDLTMAITAGSTISSLTVQNNTGSAQNLAAGQVVTVGSGINQQRVVVSSGGSNLPASGVSTISIDSIMVADGYPVGSVVVGDIQPEYNFFAGMPLIESTMIVPPLLGATHGSAPGAPTGVTLTPGNQSMGVSWIATSAGIKPNGAGTSSILFYTVNYRLTGASSWSTLTPNVIGSTSVNLTGLLGGNSYDVEVFAWNSVTCSVASTIVSATPSGTGSLPTNVQITTVAGSFVGDSGGVQTITNTLPTATAGNTLIALFSANAFDSSFGHTMAPFTSITGGPPGVTWTVLSGAMLSESYITIGIALGTGYSRTPTPSTISANWALTTAGGGIGMSLQVMEFSGISASPLDTDATFDNQNPNTTSIPISITPSSTYNLLLAFGATSAGGLDITGPNWPNNSGSSSAIGWQYMIAENAFLQTAQWSVDYSGGDAVAISLNHA